MTPEVLTILALAVPALGAVMIALLGPLPNRREGVTFVTAVLLFVVVLALSVSVFGGARPHLSLIEIMPGISIAFTVEPLGMLFALVASSLWIVNSAYSVGYMRGNDEPRQTAFFVCFAIALASTLGIAFAGNLFTLFIFYEVLTLSTYPLVAHHGDRQARQGARTYLILLLGTSIVLLLPAIIWTWVLPSRRYLGGACKPDRHCDPAWALCVRYRKSGAHAVPPLATLGDGGTHTGQCAAARRGGRESRGVYRS